MTDLKQGVFGIDLGTTYSAIAYIDESGKPVVVQSAVQGTTTTPSVVHFENESNVVVGMTAKQSAMLEPDKVVSLVKRQMGNADYAPTFFGKTYSAPAISAFILQGLALDAQMETGRIVDKVVVTVPAYFGATERAATRQAGEIAGLDVIGIVPEPVAAAIAYGLATEAGEKNILVYDLGGGTFDVTVISLTAESIDTVAVAGNHQLGGADWDAVLFEMLKAGALEQIGDDSIFDEPEFIQELWAQAEDVKKHLSQSESRPVLLRSNGGRAKVTVTRAEFEKLTAHLVQSTIDLTRRALELADIEVPGISSNIDEVILVGGSSLMPVISSTLRSEFGWNPKLSDPHLAIAKGAALYAAGVLVREMVDRTVGEKRSAPSNAAAGDSFAQNPETEAEREASFAAAAEEVGLQVGIDANRLLGIAKKANINNRLPKAIGVELGDKTVTGWQTMNPAPTYVSHQVAAQTELPYDAAALGEVFPAGTSIDFQDVVRVAIWEQASPEPGSALSSNSFLAAGEIIGLAQFRLPAGSPIYLYFGISEEGDITVRAVEPTSGKDLQVTARIQLLSAAQMDEAKLVSSGITVST